MYSNEAVIKNYNNIPAISRMIPYSREAINPSS